MPQRPPDPKRSAAAKKAAATRRRRAEEAELEKATYEIWEKRIRDLFILALGLWVAINELAFRETIRESALMFAAAILGVPFVLAAASRKP